MSRELRRYSEAGEGASPEVAFMRAVIRTARLAHPSGAKMAEIAGRLGPILTSERTTRMVSSRTLRRAALVVIVGALLTSAVWLRRRSAGSVEAPEGSDAPLGVTQGAVDPSQVGANGTAPNRVAAAVETPKVPERSMPVDALPVDALPEASAAIGPSRPASSAAKQGCSDEVAILERAETALRANDGARALALAEEHRSRCKAGAFVQERERIAIEALASLGRFPEMRRRARTFEGRFPASPHLRGIRRLLAEHAD